MLGLLASLGLFGGLAAKNAYDNASMKRYSTTYDEKGNRHYYDNDMHEYVNGERVRDDGYTDNNGIYHRTKVGVNSDKVYNDYISPSEQMKIDAAEKELKWALEHNKLTIFKYNPQFKTEVTTEISTGKVIACLMDYPRNGVMHYRKFYVKPGAKPYEYNKTADGDYGIEITKEEFERLEAPSLKTYSCLPSDTKVVHALYEN